MLTDAQRHLLLRTARASIASLFSGNLPDPSPDPIEDLPEASGVFVTIKRGGELRGCLGVLELRGSLVDRVALCARDSATRDPRFPPLDAAELPEIRLEISVLSPPEEIDPHAPEAIVVGRHGLVVEQGVRRGLLLPQVAVEWGWTEEQFLRQTCRKAGLPLEAWRLGARVFRFEAMVVGE